MNSPQCIVQEQTNDLFKKRYLAECKRVTRFMVWLMIAQWFVGIGFALFFSPLTWIGQSYEVHVHVWAAILLGGSISGFAIFWSRAFPESAHSRHVMAICQVLWSALLIHLSGGRIETHFHVFASLAILSIYRDWKILITATIVVAADHFIRGVYFPLSAFGIDTASPYRWIEHAAWVIFEVSFLVPGCMRLRKEIGELCARQTEIQEAKRSVDIQVEERTMELLSANEMLARKTEESEKLALVARHTDNAVVITDDQLNIEWVNEGFTRITGYKLNEVIGKKYTEFQQGPNSDRAALGRIRESMKNQTGFDAEVINYRKNGDPYWLGIEVRPIHDEDGNVSRFIAIQSDVSERKSIEISLAATEQRLRSLVNNVPGAFYRCHCDNDHSMIFISNSITEISGFSPKDFVENGQVSKSDIIFKDDAEMVSLAIQTAIEKQEDYEIEYRIVDRFRNTKWVWERGQCLLDDDGAKVLDGMIFDITERKASEAELESKGKVIEDSLNEIFIFNAETMRFEYVNRGGRANIGYSLEELRQLTPIDIKPCFTLESFQEMVLPLANDEKQQIVFQTTHQRKDETTYVAEIRLQKSLYQDREVFLAMILDVSDQVEAEAKSNRLQNELVEASRKAGMADVATGVLHNVGNILNSVNVSASVIRRRIEKSSFAKLKKASGLILEKQESFADFVINDERGRKLPQYILKVTDALDSERQTVCDEFDDLLKNVEHIKEIVNAQQNMAKSSSGVSQILCPEEIINDVLTATRGSIANHQIKLVKDIDVSTTRLVSDKHKILQILVNLVGNAKDALVENNTLEPTISINVCKEGDYVLFQIADNGIGIPSQALAKIFQHGFTTKEKGHGFGLHCSANAATELGGSLSVTSDGAGQGACFRLLLPLVNEFELEVANGSNNKETNITGAYK